MIDKILDKIVYTGLLLAVSGLLLCVFLTGLVCVKEILRPQNGDMNHDGKVNIQDLSILATQINANH